MKNGYYLMSRGWMDNPALSNPSPYDRRSAWVWIIEKACYRDTRQDVLGKTTIVVRTSLVTSVRYLAQQWRWSEKAVRTFLKRLEKEGMIRTETGLGKTQIFVTNYDSYQLNGQAEGTEGASQGRQKKEVKESKENIYISKDEFVQKMKSLYPKRKGNLEITTSYNRVLSKVKKNELTFNEWFFAVSNYRKECENLNSISTSFVKMASTFANGKYKDYLDASDTSDGDVEEWKAF
jgi:DNA-binding transcriptional regulator YhcF (GntR family)